MKKFVSAFLIVMALCMALTMTAFASGDAVASPEKENTVVDPDPVSPPTGCTADVIAVAAAALACGTGAVVSVKKVHNSRA